MAVGGVAVIVAVIAAVGPGTQPTGRASAPSSVSCALFSSPSGSDSSGDGSLQHPFASLVRLDRALSPGQTGCLRAGSYGSTATLHQLENSGSAQAPITISAYPGESVTITGWVDIEASYTTLENVNIDGSNTFYDQERSGTSCPYPVSQPLVIAGTGDVLQYDDYYQSVASLRGNGIGIGFWGDADNTIIRYDRIHDVGQCEDFDHLIYLSHGNNVQIYDNWMWNDPHGWGVQLYPAPTNAHVYANVIDNAGSGFVVGGGSGVSGNTIDDNIVLNSTGLVNAGLPQGVGISTCCGLGSDNSFSDNDVYANPGGISAASGITLTDNTTGSPQLADPENHDFRPTSASPAPITSWGLWDGGLGSSGS